jgi:hypothetical protein
MAMRHPDLGFFDEQADLTDAALYATAARPFGDASVLPPVAYRSKAFSELEDEKIWTRSWVAVGLQQQIPDPGDVLPFTVGYHGIHVQRGADGGLTGRFNKAQHGGCRAVPLQCQTGIRTKCSFTSCGHSRDREVISADELGDNTPAMHQYLGLVPEKLLPVRVETWGPFIFVNLDPEAPALAEELGDMPGDITGYFKKPLAVAAGQWFECAANWKLTARAFADACLAPRASPSIPRAGPFFSASASTGELDFTTDAILPMLREPSDATSANGTICWLFPNLLLGLFPTHVVSVILQPLGMGECLQRFSLLAGAPTTSETAESVSRLHDSWSSCLARSASEAKSAQEFAERWGTPHNPESMDKDLSIETSMFGYHFQQYLIQRLSTTHQHYWNAPLYNAGIAT